MLNIRTLLTSVRALWQLIGTGVSIATTAAQAPSNDRDPQLFVMSDGNLVAVYQDTGTLGYCYRIKSGGTWGAATQIVAITGLWTFAACQNGDNVYFMVLSTQGAQSLQLRKLAYSAGAITITTGTIACTRCNNGGAITLAYDTTNNFIHILFDSMDTINGNSVSMQCFDATTLNFKYGSATITSFATPTNGCPPRKVILDGSGNAFAIGTDINGGTFSCTRLAIGATSYTSTTVESGLPVPGAAVTRVAIVWDGSTIIVAFNAGTGGLNWFVRTAANTFSAINVLVTCNLFTSIAPDFPSFHRRAGTSDVVLVWTSIRFQANGEIQYMYRKGGVWKDFGGTGAVLVGGAATGFRRPLATFDDRNGAGTCRVFYQTGTANPWTYNEITLS